MMSIPAVQLADGHAIPALGLGTYKLRGPEGVDTIRASIDAGYRLVDTALNYENEREVGEAIRTADVPRDDLIVTSKLPGRFHGYDETMRGFDETMRNLGIDTLDLFLIHWPNPLRGKFVDTWRAMIALRDAGRIRSIGTSNFTARHLSRLHAETGEFPVVNQVELHPYFPQEQQRRFHRDNGIVTEAWSPLARAGDLFAERVIGEIAAAHEVSPAQVVLRWHTQIGSIPIPKTSSPDRARENADLWGFALHDDEVARITGLRRGRLWDGDPETHEEF